MKFRTLGHIAYNNEHYHTGDEIELSSAEAAPLLEVGAIEPMVMPFSKIQTNQSNQEPSHV